MFTKFRLFTIAAVVGLACMGCSSSNEDSTASSSETTVESASSDSPSAESESVEAAAGDSGSGEFCSQYATRVAQGLVGIRAAEEGGIAVAEDIASELAANAPVSQSELQEVAPPEPLAYLQALEAADAAGAAGDFSALDDLTTNLVLLTDWSIANCDTEYRPVFEEYRAVIG